jgi:hypothetical protein
VTTELGPARAVAAWWSGLGLTAVALAGWVVVDSSGRGLAWALFVATVVVTIPFLAQLVTPARFTWRLDDEGLVARTPLRVLSVRWTAIHLARVVRQAGEPALQLELVGEAGPESHLVLLPVGADLAELHRALAHHLSGDGEPTGAAGPRPAAGSPPAAGTGGFEGE